MIDGVWNASELKAYPNTGRFLSGRTRHEMTDAQKRVLEDAIEETATFKSSRRILERGEVYDRSTILIDGFVMRSMDGPERRHGLSFHVPGDFVDLHCFALKRLDHNIDTVGPVTLGYAPHRRLQRIMAEHPDVARILWFATLIDAAIHREWVMKLEQLTVPRRIAHIFAENWYRLRLVGLGDDDGYDTPLTQGNLAEMVGATTIHVNRALKQLREQGIARFSRGRIDISDARRLAEYGTFQPDYLYGSDAYLSNDSDDEAADD